MLSVVINVKNAASTLEACLNSVIGLVDVLAGEIIIVDMHSSDQTLTIARQFTDHIYEFDDVGYADPAREFAFSKANYSWLMIIDADETAPQALCDRIQSIVEQNNPAAQQADCYYIPRHNKIFDYYLNHTLWYPDFQLRLFRRGSIEWVPSVHSQPIIKGSVQYFPDDKALAFLHENYTTISDYWQRTDKYTSFQAKKIIADYKKSTESPESAPSAELDFSPAAFLERFTQEFNRRFFAGEAYKDGNHGFILSLFQATAETATLGKIWQAARFPHQKIDTHHTIQIITKWRQELAYHQADLGVKNAPNLAQKFYWQFRRKFKI